MPRKDSIVNLPGFSLQKVSGHNPLILDVHYRRKARCVYCAGKQLRKKSSYVRTVRHETIGHRSTVLRFKAYKFYCNDCHRYFNQQFPGIGKYQRATERLQTQIFDQHTEGISQQSLSRRFYLGKATIERWYHKGYQRAYAQLKNQRCPSVLGIDEHSFSKKQGYVTTLCNLKKHRVFDIVKGRSLSALKNYFEQLQGKEHVKVICIDLSSSYRQLIKRYFPKAKIVADRFHVIRLMLHQCMQTYHTLAPHLKYQRGLLKVLRTNPENLKADNLHKRDAYLKAHPAIAAIYQFKRRLHRLLMKKTMPAKRCKRYLPLFLQMLTQLKQSPFKPLATLGRTLYQWQEEIVRMWRFRKNNGITEGFHRKMKLIQRRAYGFRNFENYRLRVRVLCS